jgi:mRNA interferase RelE/StbE
LEKLFEGVKVVKGIKFVIDDAGQKKAVLIDIKKHKEIWEDFYDVLLVKERESEPRESLKEVKKKVLGRS